MAKRRTKAEAAAALAAEHRDVVHEVARRLIRRLPVHILYDDLVSAGHEGLMEAARRFDPKRGIRFPAYAQQRVRGAILDDLREQDSLSRDMRRISTALHNAEQDLTATLGRRPSDDELARELGISTEALTERRLKLAGHTVLGFGDLHPSQARAVEADPAPSPLDMAQRAQLCRYLEAAVASLPPRTQQVMTLYYRDDLTLREIGKVMGFTESRACQVIAEALQKLRGLVDPDVVGDIG